MQKHIVTIVAVVGALTAAHPFEGLAQDAAAKARAVLADARAALGGDETLRAVKTLQAAGDYRRSMGEMQMEGELELLLETPDKLRRNETIGVPGGATLVRTEVLNGDEVWEDSSQRGGMGGHMTMVLRGPGGREMDEEQVRQMRRRARRADLSRYLLVWLLATDAAVTHAGIAEAPDGKGDVLDVKPAEGSAMRLFIDQQTHLPLMLTWQGPPERMMVRRGPGRPNPEQPGRDAASREPPPHATFELRFDEYRTVDGIRLPHQISRGVNGSVNEEWSVKTYKVNPAFKSNTFTK
ncbi:MAG: hypothetical protein ACRD26_16725 [Vicinamibacterales bacterium]